MNSKEKINQRIGILGGGQLGKMLFTAGISIGMDIHIMDKSRDFPAGRVCHQFYEGDFTDYDDVMSFGRDKDILTIEIEKINVQALHALQKLGKGIYPQPHLIEIIQDKGTQKQFYEQQGIPSSRYDLYDDMDSLKRDIDQGRWTYPFIQKIRKDGYDGRGVKAIRSAEDLQNGFPDNFLVEDLVAIEKEIAVIVCRSTSGDLQVYDPVEMVFDPHNHILLYQIGPAELTSPQTMAAMQLAQEVGDAYGIVGLLAIEMFLTEDGDFLVNEVAPRPHNSGHHTIEAAVCSQYSNHLRAVARWPLGDASTSATSLLVNVLGEPGHEGPAIYAGLEEVLALPGVHVHLYGKSETRPFRKMGHVNIVGSDRQALIETYHTVSSTLKVIT